MDICPFDVSPIVTIHENMVVRIRVPVRLTFLKTDLRTISKELETAITPEKANAQSATSRVFSIETIPPLMRSVFISSEKSFITMDIAIFLQS